MSHLAKRLCLVLVVLGTVPVISCSKGFVVEAPSEDSSSPVDIFSHALRITDPSGNPIEGASVMFGASLNDPFPGNILTTDKDGIVLKPKEIQGLALPVSVQALGYVPTRLEAVTAKTNGRFTINPVQSTTEYEFLGQTSGYQDLENDGLIDASVIVPAVRHRELLTLDIQKFLSPETDIMRVLAEDIVVPKNLSIPSQVESLGFLPTLLDKANFNVTVRGAGLHPFSIIHTKINLDDYVDSPQDNFGRRIIPRSTNVVSHTRKFLNTADVGSDHNIPIGEYSTDRSVEIVHPFYYNNEYGHHVALSKSNDYFYPISMKRFLWGESTAMELDSSDEPKYILTFKEQLGIDVFGRVSLAIDEAKDGLKPLLLSLPKIQWLRQGYMELKPPQDEESIKVLGTYIRLEQLEVVDLAKDIHKKTTLMEFYSKDWLTSIDVPPEYQRPTGPYRYRWSVYFLGRKQNTQQYLFSMDDYLKSATHLVKAHVTIVPK